MADTDGAVNFNNSHARFLNSNLLDVALNLIFRQMLMLL